MRHICGWCGVEMHPEDDEHGIDGLDISHGLCATCYEDVMGEHPPPTCSWCGQDISVSDLGMCQGCADEMALRKKEEAEEIEWARAAIPGAPHCVLEQLGSGLAPVEAKEIAMKEISDRAKEHG